MSLYRSAITASGAEPLGHSGVKYAETGRYKLKVGSGV